MPKSPFPSIYETHEALRMRTRGSVHRAIKKLQQMAKAEDEEIRCSPLVKQTIIEISRAIERGDYPLAAALVGVKRYIYNKPADAPFWEDAEDVSEKFGASVYEVLDALELLEHVFEIPSEGRGQQLEVSPSVGEILSTLNREITEEQNKSQDPWYPSPTPDTVDYIVEDREI